MTESWAAILGALVFAAVAASLWLTFLKAPGGEETFRGWLRLGTPVSKQRPHATSAIADRARDGREEESKDRAKR
jgi:hypothetical protein